ncbi:hypothetical protein BDF14DRAFT_1753482 [Spinellus fusiger]|nr:hypothetical protein BDF14DRAFT_1753482 [Spinellus fusiger]
MFASAALVVTLFKAQMSPDLLSVTSQPIQHAIEILHKETEATEDTDSVVSSQNTIVDEDALAQLKAAVHSFFGAKAHHATQPQRHLTDANHAVDYIAHCLSDIVFVYPGGSTQDYLGHSLKAWASSATPVRNGRGDLVKVVEMETRTGALTAVQGALADSKKQMTVMATTQALLSMLSNVHALALARQPVVFHIAAQFTDEQLVAHSHVDAILAARNSGAILLSSSNVQEAHDMALVAHLLSHAVQLPVIHYFDGLAAATTLQTAELLPYSQISRIFQQQLPSAVSYSEAYGVAKQLLAQFNYTPFEYVGDKDASTVLVALGASTHALCHAVSSSPSFSSSPESIGLVSVRLYRPWSEIDFIEVLPKTATQIIVLEEGEGLYAFSGPLFLDITSTIRFGGLSIKPRIITAQARHLHHLHAGHMPWLVEQASQGNFIDLQSAPWKRNETEENKNTLKAMFWDGQPSQGTGVQIAHLLHQSTPDPLQVHSVQDSLRVGGAVTSTFITTAKSVPGQLADYVAIHDIAILKEYDVLGLAAPKAIVVVEGPWKHGDDIEVHLTNEFKLKATQLEIQLYAIDSARIMTELELQSTLMIPEAVFHALVPSEQGGAHLESLYTLSESPSEIKRSLSTIVQQIVDKVATALVAIELLPPWTILEINDTVLPLVPVHRTLNAIDTPSLSSSSVAAAEEEESVKVSSDKWHKAAWHSMFKEAYGTTEAVRPHLQEATYVVPLTENRQLTPSTYDRYVFHLEFDTSKADLKYDLGDALGVYGHNDPTQVHAFLSWYGLCENDIVLVGDTPREARSVFQLFSQTLDLFGRPSKKFYEALATHAKDAKEREQLLFLISPLGKEDFKARVEDTVTYEDLLREFTSAHPPVEALVSMISPIKPRHYSIASSQRMHPDSVHLLVVAVEWETKKGSKRYGQCTRYLAGMKVGTLVTVSIKHSVMKLPPLETQPVIMAGLGTGMAPFRAFIQERAMAKAAGKDVGPVVLYFGSRNRHNEYLYGEELEAYQADGVVSHMGLAFSRDQKEKVYIQHKMKEDAEMLHDYLVNKNGHFYLCGPTWPVPDVKDAVVYGLEQYGNIDSAKASALIEEWKEKERYILEVY